MKNLFYIACLFVLPAMAQQTTVSTLEDTGVEFNEENYWNGGKIGEPEEGDWGEEIYHCTWQSGLITGHVDYNFMDSYDWWGGIALSQRTGTELNSLDDQYNNIVGAGANGSSTFGVIYGDLYSIDINVQGGATVKSLYVVNSAYTMKNVLVGDGYSPKFQNEGDHIYLNITATKSDGTTAQEVVKLAEFTTELSYIAEWTKVDLSGFGDDVTKLTFTFDAHNKDVPLYACIDDIEIETPATGLAVADFEAFEIGNEGHMSVSTEEDDDRTEFVDGSFKFATGCMSNSSFWYWFGYANRTDTKFESLDDQWNNVVGGGYDGSANYGVAYVADFMGLCSITVLGDEPVVVPGFYITNSSYAYAAIKDGNGAKQFGLGDWFKLTITGFDGDDNVTGTKEFYLADLRDAATAYIIDDWRYVDLSGLGAVKKLNFTLSSTDNGDWGMNTPAYFCFDNFGAEGEEVLPEKNVEITSTAIKSLTTSLSTSTIYDVNGRQMSKLQKGVNIIRMSDGTMRKVMVK